MTAPVTKETFFDAIDRDDIAAVQKYLADGYHLGERNHAGNTELAYSLVRKRMEIAEVLLDNSGTLDLRCSNHATALQFALIFGYGDFAAKMIDRGASFGPDMKDKFGNYPLAIIEEKDMEECLLAVWRRYQPATKETMLLAAISSADLPRLRLLVERGGADVVTRREKLEEHLQILERARTNPPYHELRAYIEECWKKADVADFIASGPVKTAKPLPKKPSIRF